MTSSKTFRIATTLPSAATSSSQYVTRALTVPYVDNDLRPQPTVGHTVENPAVHQLKKLNEWLTLDRLRVLEFFETGYDMSLGSQRLPNFVVPTRSAIHTIGCPYLHNSMRQLRVCSSRRLANEAFGTHTMNHS